MSTYSEHEQRALDQSGGRALDRLASAPAILVGSVPLRGRRPDFTTPPAAPQFSGWANVSRWCQLAPARMRRIWMIDPRHVSPRCWRWLTSP